MQLHNRRCEAAKKGQRHTVSGEHVQVDSAPQSQVDSTALVSMTATLSSHTGERLHTSGDLCKEFLHPDQPA
jgi:hypothetical protein